MRSLNFTCKSILLVLFFFMCSSQAAAIQPLSPETAIYQIILKKTEGYYVAWSYNRNDTVYDQAGVYYSKNPDNLYWDPLPPLKGYRGWAEYQNVITSVWKPHGLAAAGILFAHDGSFQAWGYQDVIWTTANCLVYAQYDSGQNATMPCRGTQIWTKENGKWLLAHEHFSGTTELGGKLFQSTEKAVVRRKPSPEFLKLSTQVAAAWSGGPVETMGLRLRKFYAPGQDSRLYMPWAPHDGFQTWSDFERGLDDYVTLAAEKIILTLHDDLEATQHGDIAWTTATVHLGFVGRDGTQVSADGRQTLIWIRQDNNWRIVHQHLSIPMGQ